MVRVVDDSEKVREEQRINSKGKEIEALALQGIPSSLRPNTTLGLSLREDSEYGRRMIDLSVFASSSKEGPRDECRITLYDPKYKDYVQELGNRIERAITDTEVVLHLHYVISK